MSALNAYEREAVDAALQRRLAPDLLSSRPAAGGSQVSELLKFLNFPIFIVLSE